MDATTLSIAIGLVISLLFTEAFGLSGGGMIVPGYLALYLDRPLSILLTLFTALLTYFVVKAIAKFAIVYGRRRISLMILFGFLLGSLIRGAASWFQPEAVVETGCLCVIGFIIPGLIALWMDRQGIVQTLAPLTTSSVVVRLALILIGVVG